MMKDKRANFNLGLGIGNDGAEAGDVQSSQRHSESTEIQCRSFGPQVLIYADSFPKTFP